MISNDNKGSGLTVLDVKKDLYLNNGILGAYSLVSGQLLIGPFRILSSGKFELTANSENFNSSIIQAFKISNLQITNSISFINLKISNQNISIYQNIDFNVTIYGEDKNPYMLEALIEIFESNSSNILNCTNLYGYCTIKLNASDCGNFSFKAKSQQIISSPQATRVEKWILVPETLKIVIFM